MNMQDVCKAAKTFGEYFSSTTGVILFIFGVVSVFFIIPPFISLPTACGLGLLVGAYGGYAKMKELKNRELQIKEKEKQLVLKQLEAKEIEKKREEALKEVHEIRNQLRELREDVSHLTPPDSTRQVFNKIAVASAEIKSTVPVVPANSEAVNTSRRILFDAAIQTEASNEESFGASTNKLAI